MSIGVLTAENKDYLDQYKTFGFRNKTDMLNEALIQLRKHEERNKRRKALLDAGIDYGRNNEYAWADLDGDDFED